MKELIFIATTKKLTRKCLRISNSFVIIFAWTESLSCQTVMLQWYLCIKVSLTLHFYRCIMVQNWYRWWYIPIHALASEIGLPICCVLPAMHAGCDSVSSFSHIKKMAAFQTLKNKIDQLTHMIELVISISLFSPSAVISWRK